MAQAPSPADMQRAKAFMQKSMGMMKPELQEKVKALPPEIQQFLSGSPSGTPATARR